MTAGSIDENMPVAMGARNDQTRSAADGPVIADIVGSGALAVYSIVASVSFAALVFAGPASDGLPRGVERPAGDAERLVGAAGRLAVYELHGSLFFGSVSGVAEVVRERLSRPSAPVEIVIVDFARVADIDSSAYAVLGELADDVAAAEVRLIWSELPRGAAAVLERSQQAAVDEAPDLDSALEAAEDQLLIGAAESSVSDQGEPDSDGSGYSVQLLEYFETRQYEAGDVVLREGDPSDELLVVISGEVRASRADRTGRELRLRTLRAGAILGEIGFLTAEPRSATVTAQTDVELRVLSAAAHTRLRREQPELVIELYDRVLRSTAARAAAIHRSLTQALR